MKYVVSFAEAPSSLRFVTKPRTTEALEGESVTVECTGRDVFPPGDVTFRIFYGDQTLHSVTFPNTHSELNDDGTYDVSAQVDVRALRQFNIRSTRLICEVDYLERGSADKPSKPLTLNVNCKSLYEYSIKSDVS